MLDQAHRDKAKQVHFQFVAAISPGATTSSKPVGWVSEKECPWFRVFLLNGLLLGLTGTEYLTGFVAN